MQKKRNILLVFILLLLMTSLASGQANFSVTPQLIELELAPGSRYTIKVLLINETERDSQRFQIYASDVIQNEAGTYKVVEKGKSKFSCADWIKLDTMEVGLGPKKGKEIPFQIQVPATARGGRYGAIVFNLQPKVTQMGEEYAGGTAYFFLKVPVQIEITIKSYLTPKPKNVKIKSIDVIPVSEDKEYAAKFSQKNIKDALLVRAHVNNGGDMHIIAKGRLIIKDQKGRRLRVVPLGGGRGMVLPQTDVYFTSIIKRPLAGDYIAEAVINYGGLSSAIGEASFSVTRSGLAKKGTFKGTTPIAILVSREVLDVAAPPKGVRTQILSLTNQENEPVKIRTKVNYLLYDEYGNTVVTDSGLENFSCIKWLTIEPTEFEIQPGEKQAVKVTLNVPDVTPGGRYANLMFETFLKNEQGITIPIILQIPYLLTITGKTERQGEITKVVVGKGNPPSFAVYFKNTGNIHINPNVKIELKYLPKIQRTDDLTYIGEPKSELVGVLNLKRFPVDIIPGGIAKLENDYKQKLGPGNYMAVVTADFGVAEPVIFIHKFKI